jgi:DNA-binding CsgD family transcriptional regulator
MIDILWNSQVLGAMQAHACLTEEEKNVMKDWADGKSVASTSMNRNISDSTVYRIRNRLRRKYDSIQGYANLPPRK